MSYDQTSKQTNRHPNFLFLDVLMIEKNFTENNYTCFPIFENVIKIIHVKNVGKHLIYLIKRKNEISRGSLFES